MAIHATDDDIILTDISSWADLPARTKREQIVRSLGNLQSRTRQYITNVDRVATHLSDQGQDARAFIEEEERLLNQFVDMRAASTQVNVAGKGHHDLFLRRWPPSEPCSQLSGRPLSEGMVQRVLQREEVGVRVGVAVRH